MKSAHLFVPVTLRCLLASAFPAVLLVGSACVTPAERGPSVVLRGHGELAERVQAQVSIVDMKLATAEKLCTREDGSLEDRCLAPLDELKRKRAYFRQRSYALATTAASGSLEDITRWQELEIELELLGLEVDELTRTLRQ